MKIIPSCGAVLAAFLVLGPLALAQAPSNQPLTELNLEQLMKVQFYTASKHAQDLSETPASVTIVPHDAVATHFAFRISDLYSLVVGIGMFAFRISS